MMTEKIGIVTVLYNSDDVLPDFFFSLSLQTNISYKLYVIDNSPTDSGCNISRELAQKYRIDVEIVFNNANVGVARGNNQGIRLALADACEYVLLANNDTEFSVGTIRNLLDTMVVGNDVVATPKILYFGAEPLIWFAGGDISSWTVRSPHFDIMCLDVADKKYPQYTNYAPTCFMLLHSSVFTQLGLMDESYFVYYDDTDFVWRMKKAGYKIRFVDSSVVLHKVSTSTGGGDSQFSLYYTNRNRVYFARKNFYFLKKYIALSYIFITRMYYGIKLPRKLAKNMWAGFFDGFKLPINRDVS